MSSMQKNLLKLLTFEVFERLSRFYSLLERYGEEVPADNQPIVAYIGKRLDELRDQLLSEKAEFRLLYSENANPILMNNAQASAMLERCLFQPYNTMNELLALFSRGVRCEVLPELFIALKEFPSPVDFGLVRAGQGPFTRSILLAQELPHNIEAADCPYPPSEELIIEALPVLQQASPLGWVWLLRRQLSAWVNGNEALEAFRVKNKSVFEDVAFFRRLVFHLAEVRVFGPAAYYFGLTEALVQKDRVYFERIEPAMFFAVNHGHFIEKNLVLFHEASEHAGSILENAVVLGGMSERFLHKDHIQELLLTLERLLPDKVAFTEKQFERSVLLQNKLEEDILISSSSFYPLTEADERLQLFNVAIENGTAPADGVYEVLNMVEETPSHVREILNAGWIQKLERHSAWLYTALETEDGFERLKDSVSHLDGLLLRSIETAELHRMLLCSA